MSLNSISNTNRVDRLGLDRNRSGQMSMIQAFLITAMLMNVANPMVAAALYSFSNLFGLHDDPTDNSLMINILKQTSNATR